MYELKGFVMGSIPVVVNNNVFGIEFKNEPYTATVSSEVIRDISRELSRLNLENIQLRKEIENGKNQSSEKENG